jgi:hypothetical protein
LCPEALFTDRGLCGIELVDGVADPQLLVGVALVSDRSGVALDGWGGALAGAFEVVLGSLELVLGDVEVVAERAAVPARTGVEPIRGGTTPSTCVDGARFGVAQGVSVSRGRGRDLGQDAVGGGGGGGRLSALG